MANYKEIFGMLALNESSPERPSQRQEAMMIRDKHSTLTLTFKVEIMTNVRVQVGTINMERIIDIIVP